ncbi:MAG TPA: hypothetical protein VIH90_04990 [Candidatus Saccharimonadales bacterium]
MRHLTYLFSIIGFCGIPWLIMLKYQERMLKKYEKVILLVVATSILFSASDFFTLRWGAWYYNPGQTLNIRFITEIETFLFAAAVFLVVASATIISAAMVDNRSRQLKRRSKRKT